IVPAAATWTPGSPVSRPVTTTGEPKPPAPRAAGAMTRPSGSARVHRCAFMEGMHSRGEESPRSLLRRAIGERGKKKGGIQSPTWARVAGRTGEGPGTPAGTGRAGPATLRRCRRASTSVSATASSTPTTRSGARAPWKTDRKSTRLNSSHTVISYAVFCLKKKKNIYKYAHNITTHDRHTHIALL